MMRQNKFVFKENNQISFLDDAPNNDEHQGERRFIRLSQTFIPDEHTINGRSNEQKYVLLQERR